MIKLGFEAEVIQQAISKLLGTPGAPLALIAGGIALTAIGSAISNLGVQQHAEGGIFDKPTLIGNHLFGEKGKEVLLPLNRLQGMMGNNSNDQLHVTGTVEMGFDKFLILFQRAQRFTTRNYGNFNTA